MMVVENKSNRAAGGGCTGCASIYRFIFDLEDGVSFGSKFECRANTEADAWSVLVNRMPEAASHVKLVNVIN